MATGRVLTEFEPVNSVNNVNLSGLFIENVNRWSCLATFITGELHT